MSQKEDISKSVEGNLFTFISLFGLAIMTYYHFIVYPSRFISLIREKNPLEDSFDANIARPLAYYFFALTSVAIGFYLLFTSFDPRDIKEAHSLLSMTVEGIKDASVFKTIVSTIPIVMLTALYAYCLSSNIGKSKRRLSFSKVLYISAYFFGSLMISIFLTIPISFLFYKDSYDNQFLFYLGASFTIIIYLIILRLFYSQIFVFKSVFEFKWSTAIIVWSKGFLFFLFVTGIVFTWIYPIISH